MVSIATAAILIRFALSSAGMANLGFSLVIAASRLSLAALLLTPQLIRKQQPPIPWQNQAAITYAAGAGLALAAHFAAWITSLNYTSITASTVLVTTTPIWTTLICGLVLKESITRRTILGIAIAFCGGLLIATDNPSIQTGTNLLLGNALALCGAIMATTYLLLGRAAQQHGLTTGQYIRLAYSIAAFVLLPLPLLTGTSYFGYPPLTYLWFLMLAIVPQLLGHTSFNWAIQYLSPSLVTLAILAEPIGASLLGYLFFQEIPTAQTLQGSGIILGGIAIASLNQAKN